jgi:hypothetical protein
MSSFPGTYIYWRCLYLHSYKIPGLIKKQRQFFSIYYREDHKNRNKLQSSIQEYLQKIDSLLHKHGVMFKDLKLNYRAAYLNLKGIISFQKNSKDSYNRIYEIAENERLRYHRLRKKEIVLQFIPSQNLYHKVISDAKFIRIYISITSLMLSDEYFKSLLSILFRQILRLSIPSELKEKLAEIEEIWPSQNNVYPERNYKPKISPGKFYDLEKIFTRINTRYFKNTLSQPAIKWSHRENRRRLGHYNSGKVEITINKILDQPTVPYFVVEGIVYHELLHIVHPVKNHNGRRIIHGRNFKIDEQKYENHRNLQNWIRTDFPIILKKQRKSSKIH